MIGTAAVLLLLAGSTAGRPAAPAPRARIARDTVPEEAVIELQIGRLASQTIVAFRSDNTVLLPVSQFMTGNLETVSIHDKLVFALSKMDGGGYRHLPVLDGDRLVGIISVRDFLRYIRTLWRDS